MDVVNIDVISITGATCFEGLDFTSKFFTMSLLPFLAISIGLFQLACGTSALTKKSISKLKDGEKTVESGKALEGISKEIFLMVDEDHNGIVDVYEYNRLVRNF